MADMGEGFETSSLKPHILKHHIPEQPNDALDSQDHPRPFHTTCCHAMSSFVPHFSSAYNAAQGTIIGQADGRPACAPY